MAIVLPPITGDSAQDSWQQQVTQRLNTGLSEGAIVSESQAAASAGTSINSATINLYQRTDSDNIRPNNVSEITIYTYATTVLALQNKDTDVITGWTRTPPAVTEGDVLWLTTVSIADTAATETIDTDAWSIPSILGTAAGRDGIDGTNGTDGINTAVVSVYTRDTDEPTTRPTAVYTHTFSTGAGTFAGNTNASNGWFTFIPAGDTELWVRQAVARSREDSDTIPATEWGAVAQIGGSRGPQGDAGTPGTPGTPGATGARNARGSIYRAGTTAPAAGTVSINWTTGVVTPSTGWSNTPPAVNTLTAGQAVYTQTWVAQETSFGGTTTYTYGSVVQDVLIVNDIASENYDGDRDSDRYDASNSGTAGYFLDASSGAAVIRQGFVESATISGVPLTPLTSLSNDGVGFSFSTSLATAAYIQANMEQLTTAAWNTNRGTLAANNATGQFARLSSGAYVFSPNPSSGSIPGGIYEPTSTQNGRIGGVVVEGAGALTLQRLSSDLSGYRYAINSSAFTADSSPTPSGAANLTFYSYPRSRTNLEIQRLRCPSSGNFRITGGLTHSFGPFRGYFSSLQYAFNTIAFTVNGTTRIRVLDTDNNVVSTKTHTFAFTTNGSSVTSTTNCDAVRRDDQNLYALRETNTTYVDSDIAVEQGYIVIKDLTFTTSGTSNFIGFSLISDSFGFSFSEDIRRMGVSSNLKETLNVAAVISGEEIGQLAAIISGGEGLLLPPEKIFEGSATRVNGITAGTMQLVQVAWNNSSPNADTINHAYGLVAVPSPPNNFISALNNNRAIVTPSDTANNVAFSFATLFSGTGTVVGTITVTGGRVRTNGSFTRTVRFVPNSSFSDATITGIWNIVRIDDLSHLGG